MQSSNPASLWLRAAAVLYDLFPLIALWMVTAGATLVVSWGRGGQTIGMRAWRLRVVGADGQRLPWSRALLRFAVALVSLAVFGFGFIWCLFDRQRRGWHDIAAHSCVVRLQR